MCMKTQHFLPEPLVQFTRQAAPTTLVLAVPLPSRVNVAMWRSFHRLFAQKVARRSTSTIVRFKNMSTHVGFGDGMATPRVIVREATDTLDLIDQLLWVLGPTDSAGESGFVFFDLDETLVTRDTCLIDGLGTTRALMSRLEARLGPSSEALQTIHREMEKDYYSADPKLVDPLLARVIRALKIQGHSVFGLTSNALDRVHTPQILETLAKYKIRFSAPEVRGELPRSGALVMDHSVCRGVIFIDNQQAKPHDKGEVIAEFVSLLLHNGNNAAGAFGRGDGTGIAGSTSEPERAPRPTAGSEKGAVSPVSPRRQKRKCILVDNTSHKCEKAAASFERDAASKGLLELHTVHFTEAENLVDSPDALVQLRRILGRLRARGLIGVDLLAEDILVSPTIVSSVDSGTFAESKTLRRKKKSVLAGRRLGSFSGHSGQQESSSSAIGT